MKFGGSGTGRSCHGSFFSTFYFAHSFLYFSHLLICCFLEVPFNSSNILQRNVRPDRTTLQACCSLPTRDWRSFFTQSFFPCHWATESLSSSSLLAGKHRIIACVSNSTLRKVKHSVGPSSLLIATGICSLSKITSNFCTSSSHCLDDWWSYI